MPSWVSRALGMAVLHAAATVTLAKVAVFNPTGITVGKVLALAVLVGVAALWSALDNWLGRDRPGRLWFIAALVAGPASGVLSVLGKAVFVDETGVHALGSALTGGAAFTALLILVPAGLGLLVGGRLLPRKDLPEPGTEPDESAGPGSRPGAGGRLRRRADHGSEPAR